MFTGTEECPVKSVVNRVAVQLAKALQTKGMALLVNHGISEEKVDCANTSHLTTLNFTDEFCFQLNAVYHHLDDFCKLPEATKELYLRNSETGNHGYVKPGQERFDGKTKDIRHAYNICTLNLKLPEEVLSRLLSNKFSLLIYDHETVANSRCQDSESTLPILPKTLRT